MHISPKKQDPTAHQRAAKIVECMLAHLEQGLRDPTLIENPGWKILFGTKGNVVDQVQKLTTTLAKLQALEAKKSTDAEENDVLSTQEASIMLEWMRDQKKSNVADATPVSC